MLIYLASSAAMAVTVEDQTTIGPIVSHVNGTTVVQIEGASFSIVDIPTIANGFENSTEALTHAKLKEKLPKGELVSAKEAQQVLTAYYQKNAFEPSSIRVRGIVVGESTSWTTWCINPSLFGCLQRVGAGGTWVEFELNGRNRSGGMTGFQRTIWMVRKFSHQVELSAVK